jgi:xanthine/uracil permease
VSNAKKYGFIFGCGVARFATAARVALNKTEENMREIIGGLVVAAVFYVFLVALFLF